MSAYPFHIAVEDLPHGVDTLDAAIRDAEFGDDADDATDAAYWEAERRHRKQRLLATSLKFSDKLHCQR